MSEALVEKCGGMCNEEHLTNGEELRFTGNWFIDAGILGFVNLMEEVYGWDLDELQKRLEENEKKIYYWYFPIGYVCHIVKEIESKNSLENRKKIESLIKEIPEAPNISDPYNLFEKAWEWLLSKEHLIDPNKNRIKVNWSGRYRILTNFPLFQPKYDTEKQKSIFMEILGLKPIENKLLIYIDKVTTKFLPSLSDFPNISYTQSCITINVLRSLTPRVHIFVLTYPLAFISESQLLKSFGYWIMFYSPELEFTYNINKKLKMHLINAHENQNIFKITWNSIVDSLVESESIWSLENMYLIKIRPPKGQKQDLESVEYIGIPKLQASIIIDDTLRDALNKNIPVRASNSRIDKSIWILEELIRNKPLLPHLIHHMHVFLADRIGRRYYAGKRLLVYGVIVDAKIREFGRNNRLFAEDFFKRYKEILTEIKNDAKRAFWISNIFRDLFEDQDERKSYANLLLTKIRRNDKYNFVNTLLRVLISKKDGKRNTKSLIDFIFNKILSNDLTWKNYALIFVVGLVNGGEANGEERI